MVNKITEKKSLDLRPGIKTQEVWTVIGLDKRVAGYVADRVEDLLNKNIGKLNEVYESSGKLKVSCSIDVVDKRGAEGYGKDQEQDRRA